MDKELRIQKKAIKIDEGWPKDWEDQEGGKRHVKSELNEKGTWLYVTDANGKKEEFRLRICSTYVREGDWVTITGTGEESK